MGREPGRGVNLTQKKGGTMMRRINRFRIGWGRTAWVFLLIGFLCLPQQVLAATKTIAVNPTNLVASCPKGYNAPSQNFEVWNSGGGNMAYTISVDAAWLSVTPTSGTSSGEHDLVKVNYSTAALGVGKYSATITITAPAANNSPVHIPVRLNVGSTQPWLSLLLD